MSLRIQRASHAATTAVSLLTALGVSEGHRTRVKLLDAFTGRQQSRALLKGRIDLDLSDAPLWLKIP